MGPIDFYTTQCLVTILSHTKADMKFSAGPSFNIHLWIDNSFPCLLTNHLIGDLLLWILLLDLWRWFNAHFNLPTIVYSYAWCEIIRFTNWIKILCPNEYAHLTRPYKPQSTSTYWHRPALNVCCKWDVRYFYWLFQSIKSNNQPTAILGNIFDFAHRNIDAVLTDPKRGTGRGWIAFRIGWSMINASNNSLMS